MSYHVGSWAWRQRVNDSGAKLVLMKLAESSNDNGIAWPSQKTLAEHCEMGERNVRLKLDKLEQLGLVTIEKRTNEDGTRKSNLYRLASGTPLPMEPAENSTGSTLPKNRHLEPSEQSGIPTGSTVPVDGKICPHPHCRVTVKGKSVAEHMADTHGIGILEVAAEYAEQHDDLSATQEKAASQ